MIMMMMMKKKVLVGWGMTGVMKNMEGRGVVKAKIPRLGLSPQVKTHWTNVLYVATKRKHERTNDFFFPQLTLKLIKKDIK